ncbi:outer membrane beta-barrel protein [Prevotella multiformis]|uniref:outer membrane beta-barrel protein n=1 Tax=Prevotella multiformis TaxID=282402 RepID=UPI0023F3CAE3|nr:outer membrane beta-barrel protein [Prevotella multiformis]
MKRTILTVVIFLGVLTSSQGQIFNKNNTKRIGQNIKESYQNIKKTLVQDTRPSGEHTIWDIYIAPKIGLDLSNLPGIDGNVKLGVVGAAYVEVFVAKNIAIDAEMQYSRQGSSGVYRNLHTTDAAGTPTVREYGPYDFKLDYINTNYLVRWYPWADLPWSFTTGLHMGYIVSAHAKMKHGADKNIKRDIHSGDLALPLGISYEWKQWQLEARYNLYFRKLARSHEAEVLMRNARNNMLEVTLGYRIKMF